ncbi:MAG: hypothetical protein AAF280_08220 [Pseudomonadota bacterium]
MTRGDPTSPGELELRAARSKDRTPIGSLGTPLADHVARAFRQSGTAHRSLAGAPRARG